MIRLHEGVLHEVACEIRDRLIKLDPKLREIVTSPPSGIANGARDAVSVIRNVDRPFKLPGSGEVANSHGTTADRTPSHGNDNPGGAGSGGGPDDTGTRGGEHPGDFFVTLPDGRKLHCSADGPENGDTIIQFHGSPGSCRETTPKEVLKEGVLSRNGVRVVKFSREGLGWSDRDPEASIGQSAKKIEAILDHLGVEKCSVVGRSGGTPYAAAAAALLPDRVTSCALLVPVANPAIMGGNYFKGMLERPDRGAELLSSIEALIRKKVANFAIDPTNPLAIVGVSREHLTPEDLRILEKDAGSLCEMYADAVRQGPEGWIDDQLRQHRPWEYNYSDIRARTLVWTADGDGLTPPAHAGRIALHVPPENVRFYMVPGNEVGHFGAMRIKPSVYAWLLGREDLVRFPTEMAPGYPPSAPILTPFNQWTSLAA